MTDFTDQGSWAVEASTVHELQHQGRRWRITVARPLPAPPAGTLTPVLYVLDPFGTLGTAVHIARVTHLLSQGALPALLIVGVGPASDDLAELSRRRSLDLTPGPPDAQTEKAQAPAGFVYGGAEAFLDVLVDVIAPLVEAQYSGDPTDRTLAGWSLGGLTAAHALLTRPADFRRYLMVSPSLWWGDDAVLQLLPRLAGQSRTLHVYLAAGDLEETGGDRSWPVPSSGAAAATAMGDARMVSNLRVFADALQAHRLPALTVDAEVLRGEHHITVWAAAFSRGLLALHAPTYRLEG